MPKIKQTMQLTSVDLSGSIAAGIVFVAAVYCSVPYFRILQLHFESAFCCVFCCCIFHHVFCECKIPVDDA